MLRPGLLEHLDMPLAKVMRVRGGDINDAFSLETDNGKFFLKINNADKYPFMFELEAQGLSALCSLYTLRIPDVLKCGAFEQTQYLLLEWLEECGVTSTSQADFGSSLALMHKVPQESFGFIEDNYLGTAAQRNTFTDTWKEFYTCFRIMPLVRLLYNDGKVSPGLINQAERFCGQIDDIFPLETPSLLHGDLWSGNYITTASGTALIDPAVYYGHREMDIGMSKLFGGFGAAFYYGYNEAYPLETNWERRLNYTQLYPLLFHAHAFGGTHLERVGDILQPF